MRRVLVGVLAVGLFAAFTLDTNDADAGRIGRSIGRAFRSVGSKIKKAVTSIPAKIGKFSKGLQGIAKTFAGKGIGALAKGLPGIGGIVGKVTNFAKGVVGKVKGVAGKVMRTVRGIAGKVKGVAGKVMGTVRGIAGKVKGAVGKVVGAAKGLANRAQSFIKKRAGFFKNFGAKGGITKMLGKFKGAFKGGPFSTLGKMLTGAKSGIAPMLRNFGLQNVLKGGLRNKLTGIVTRLGQKGGVKQLGAFMTRFKGKAKAAFGAVTATLREKLEALKAKVPAPLKAEIAKVEEEASKATETAAEVTDAAAVSAAATAQLPDQEKDLADKDDGTSAKVDESSGQPLPDQAAQNDDPPPEAVPEGTPVEEPEAAAEAAQ